MGCMESALNNLFPVDWLDPYGEMPLNKEFKVQIDVTQVETDDGIKVTAVKTPPRAGTTSIGDAISMALGMGCCETEPQNESSQSADLGKRDEEKPSGDAEKSDKMKPSGSGDSEDRDRNPGPQGSRPSPSRYGATQEQDAKKPRE